MLKNKLCSSEGAKNLLREFFFCQGGSVITGPVKFGLVSHLVVQIDKNDGQIPLFPSITLVDNMNS